MAGNGQEMEGDTGRATILFYAIIAVTGIHMVSIAGISTFESSSMNSVVAGVFLLSLLVLPVVGYLDMKRLRTATAWQPRVRGALWVLGFLTPFFSPAVVVTYLFARREHREVDGHWSRWHWLAGSGIGFVTICAILGTMFDNPATSSNTPIQDAIYLVFFAALLIPGLATYHDLSYLKRTSAKHVSRFEYLWAPAIAVPFLQIPLFLGYLWWRRKFLQFRDELETAEAQCQTAREQIERGTRAIAADRYEDALAAFDDAEAALRTVRDTLDDVDETAAGRPSRLENMSESFEELQHSLDRERARATGRKALREGEAKLADGEYEQAVTTLRTAVDSLESALDSDTQPQDELREALERATDQLDTAREQFVATELTPLAEEIESTYAAGQNALAEGEYDRAAEQFETANDDLSRFRQLNQEYDLQQDPPLEMATLDEQRTAVERERSAARLDAVATDLDTAAEQLERDEYDTATEQLEDARSELSRLQTAATEHGFDELQERCETLQERCESLLEVATSRTDQATAPERPDLSQLTVEYDALEKGETIGSGGNADVYRAHLPTADGAIPLAIKEPRMSGTLHTETIKEILSEAETWEKLDDHDHIVDIVDYGSRPLPWIAMEYMDGGPLDDRAGALNYNQALWTATGVTKAVRHAHRHGVAHLDLKPDNVLFRTVEDGWDVPKVADWGLSKQLLDHSKSIEGLSPNYAAPEQFDDSYGVADDLTDIYQLGTVFYELFTGQPPFEGKPAAVMNRVLTEDPTPPSEIADLPAELDDVLLTAMAKEKDDRYEDVLLLRNELQRLSDGV